MTIAAIIFIVIFGWIALFEVMNSIADSVERKRRNRFVTLPPYDPALTNYAQTLRDRWQMAIDDLTAARADFDLNGEKSIYTERDIVKYEKKVEAAMARYHEFLSDNQVPHVSWTE